MTKIEESLASLIDDLAGKITPNDFPEIRDACKDDVINDEDLMKVVSAKELLEFLCDKNLLSQGDPSFIEHVFELCRRPDLLTVVMEYRLSNLGLQDEKTLGKKLIRVRSSKKYTENVEAADQEVLKLCDPPKARRKSSSAR